MKKQNAFSLIEVVFVLVLLGIVSTIGSSIIVQVYESHITQRAIYNASTKTELVANQIVNRLSNRIPNSTISKDHSAFLAGDTPIKEGNWVELKDLTPSNNFTTIEWIGADNDGFSVAQNPLWSSLCNYPNSAKKGISVPGVDATMKGQMSNIMSNLSNGKVMLTASRSAAILFQEENNLYNSTEAYSPECMGLLGDTNISCIFPVRLVNDSFTFLFTPVHNSTEKRVTERFKLTWSAYTIALEPNPNNGLNTLFLYSNYQPWKNNTGALPSGADGILFNSSENYIDNGTKKTLLTNVSSFTFSEIGDSIRFKICVSERLNRDENLTTCKEKVVLP